ncbi:Lcl C-terminal domain-containing protein [Leptospira sanjuanensis]|uniref:Lcl C-terminal domain-containing protein n=1 Tax=Leptospira sanjuanensis TaxID=2879643 RepID=UPI001EE99428|nr:DUF1566 domain-containing protein [Leptospira sanjuanensis]MCG6167023.1 DUF1566 domain-containing protein [Leptospira sanjuanensis]
MRFILLFFAVLFSCVKAPEKPDPPYVVLQYMIGVVSSQNQNNQNSEDECPTGFSNFNPNAVADTGQTTCYNALGGSTPCLGTGQDGEYNNVPNARNFVGPTQHCKYPTDYTTLDTLHGLTWKSCVQGQSGSNCSVGAPNSISWTNANAGLAGSCTELNTLNGGKGYAGKTNWRIPTLRELASLLHYTNNPHIDGQFPNTFSGLGYWTNTLDPLNVGNNAVIRFDAPNLGFYSNTQAAIINLRCVSGNPIAPPAFVDNGDGTVTDSNTGLLWMKCVDGLIAPACAGVVNTQDWNGARNFCETLNFALRSDWRLPNLNELLSLADYAQPAAPLINPVFPNTPGQHWTSTTFDNVKTFAMLLSFANGQMATNDKSSLLSVRCVTTN